MLKETEAEATLENCRALINQITVGLSAEKPFVDFLSAAEVLLYLDFACSALKKSAPSPARASGHEDRFQISVAPLSSSGRGRQFLPVQQFVAQAGIEALDVSDSPMSCRARCRRSWRRLCVPKTIGRIWNCEWPVPASSSLQYAGAIYSFTASNRIMSQLSIIPHIHFSHESRSNSPMTIEQREKSVMSQTTRSCLAQS
jgi:hypothetical protein